MANDTLQSTGLIDFLSDALNSTLLADANSAEALQSTIADYGKKSVKFTLPDAVGVDHEIIIPKLAIAPLPLLRIQEAAFEIKGELTVDTSVETKINNQSTALGTKKAVLGRRLLIATKAIANTAEPERKNTTQSLSATINVKMAQADVPAGLTSLLQIAANNLQIKEK